ncbi:MAG: phenylacetate--CoA ligase family protein, partial [Betaproteobacteria bacterium]
MLLPLPASREEVRAGQRVRLRVAFERARRARWYAGRLDAIDAGRLDDADEWQKIPLLDKEALRGLTHADFMAQMCIAPREDIAEYWRSGGTTGRPLFYPRTFDDVKYALLSWHRSFPCMGIERGELCHIAFPLGIHPAGQIWARSAHDLGIGMNWAGAGNAMASEAQLELIRMTGPSVLIAMSSFALHLANLAEAKGIDLAAGTVRKIVCSAETLSAAKRAKLARSWGAEVYDVFGMSEAGLMGAEAARHDGIHVWSDMYFCEVVDPATGRQLPEGEVGALCVTPLWTNHATPFLRWNSGDVVSLHAEGASAGPFGALFPMIRHAHRTTGFFKVRGVNVNHAEFEDFIFGIAEVQDFQALLVTDRDMLETLKVAIEVRRGQDAAALAARVAREIKSRFELHAPVEVQELGTLAQPFEGSVKSPPFVDQPSRSAPCPHAPRKR